MLAAHVMLFMEIHAMLSNGIVMWLDLCSRQMDIDWEAACMHVCQISAVRGCVKKCVCADMLGLCRARQRCLWRTLVLYLLMPACGG